jgi:hypothetical protein
MEGVTTDARLNAGRWKKSSFATLQWDRTSAFSTEFIAHRFGLHVEVTDFSKMREHPNSLTVAKTRKSHLRVGARGYTVDKEVSFLIPH